MSIAIFFYRLNQNPDSIQNGLKYEIPQKGPFSTHTFWPFRIPKRGLWGELHFRWDLNLPSKSAKSSFLRTGDGTPINDHRQSRWYEEGP
jgi:hypothetical protein